MKGHTILIFAAIIMMASSICTGSQFWNPLNNACVDGLSFIYCSLSLELAQSILWRSVFKSMRFELSFHSQLLR